MISLTRYHTAEYRACVISLIKILANMQVI